MRKTITGATIVVLAVAASMTSGASVGAARSVRVPAYGARTAARLDRALLEQLGTASGAKRLSGRAGWADFLATVGAANRGAVGKIERPVAPHGRSRGAARLTVGEADAFSGVIDALIKGSDLAGPGSPDSGSSTSVTDARQSSTPSKDEQGRPTTVANAVQTRNTYDIGTSVITVTATLEAVETITDASGVVIHTVETEVVATANVFVCPDADGNVGAQGSVDATQTVDGRATTTSFSTQANGTVDDEAWLRDFSWEGQADAGGASVATKGRVGTGAKGRPDYSGATATLSSGSGAKLAGFQTALAETVMQLASGLAQDRWRNGACVEIRTTDDGGNVAAGSTTTFTATVWHRIDGGQLSAKIEPAFSGVHSLNPDHDRQPTPLDLTYRAGDQTDDEGDVTLTTTSNRGRATKRLTFTVGPTGWRAIDWELGTGHGVVCDLSKPWTVEYDIADLPPARLVFSATPSAGGREGTISAVYVNLAQAERADGAIGLIDAGGSLSLAPYRVTDAPGRFPPGSVGIAWQASATDLAWSIVYGDDGPVYGEQRGQTPAGYGLVLAADPKACPGG